ncbi:hypothetical protein PT974_05612 [Cladobotryum mycophilum]|uniref:Uncharacterized protein n=1 Tax=Cladobotryum mycophilum TaxID=491253 RepID=A0ABR0SKH9_9HYPO
MALFVDLDVGEEDDGNDAQLPLDRGKALLQQQNVWAALEARQKNVAALNTNGVSDQLQQQQQQQKKKDANESTSETERPPRAVRNAVTEAFQCYPIVFAIVSNIDLNTLDALAGASRFIHDGLIQYRTSLLAATLRCSNETIPVDPDQTLRYRARASSWHYMQEDGPRYNSGKSGSCARDLVGECRRCSEVVCRNCVIKPPASTALRERHRRLCITCARALIATLASPPLDAALPLSSDAVQRAICKCDSEGVWLCQPCGQSIRSADQEYKRIWRWRNQYGEVLGGLGTGIGDGDRGVICGREERCLAAREREHEIDCDAEDARGGANTPIGNPGFPFTTNGTIESLIDEMRRQRTPSPQLGPGYERHEIEGIGGIVKRKLVRMVRVGACVPEWEEEKGACRAAARSWRGRSTAPRGAGAVGAGGRFRGRRTLLMGATLLLWRRGPV